MEPVHLSDDSRNEYKMSDPADETEPDTQPEEENIGCVDETTH